MAELQKLAKLFNMSVHQILNSDADIPNDLTLEDKSSIEQINPIEYFGESVQLISLQSVQSIPEESVQ